jgi:hypothetical protein
MCLRIFFYAARPAARSSRSVGVLGKGAEAGDPLEESGRLRGGFRFATMTSRAGRAAGRITFQDRSVEDVSAVQALLFDGRHDPHDTAIVPVEQE